MKEKILKATASIISTGGVEAASTRAICDAVGITAPTLYHYFQDKSELIDSVTAMAFEAHLQVKSQMYKKTEGPVEKLKFLWDCYLDFAMSEPELYMIMINSVTKGQTPQVAVRCFEKLTELFEETKKMGQLEIEAVDAARLYLCGARGVAVMHLAQKKSPWVKKIMDMMRDIVLRGMLKEEGRPKDY